MALFGIGKNRVSLKLQQGSKVYELAVIGEITLTREINTASKLTATIVRDHITPEMFDSVALVVDDFHQQFYGWIQETNKHGKTCEIICYDQLFFFNSEKRSLIYENMTATQLLEKLCVESGAGMLDPSPFMDTGYSIPYRIEDNVSLLQMVQTALDITETYTGVKWYLWDDYGAMMLTNADWLAGETTVVCSLGYLEDYNYKENTDGFFNDITIVKPIKASDDDNSATIRTLTASTISREGKFSEKFEIGEEENIDHVANQILKNHGDYNRELTISSCQGDITVRGGTPVPVDFYSRDRMEYIRGWFTCQSVTHHISTHHTMDLTLKCLIMYDAWEEMNATGFTPRSWETSETVDPNYYGKDEDERTNTEPKLYD